MGKRKESIIKSALRFFKAITRKKPNYLKYASCWGRVCWTL
jgi:hypothetical protein